MGKNEAEVWQKIVAKVEGTLGKAGGGSEQLTVNKLLVPRVVCQRFRNGQPITCKTLIACFDPRANKELKFDTLKPHKLLVRIPGLWYRTCDRGFLEYHS